FRNKHQSVIRIKLKIHYISIKIVIYYTIYIKCDISAQLFSAADRCFPRARLQPPCPGKGRRELPAKGGFSRPSFIPAAGSSDTWHCTIVRPIENHLLFPQMFFGGTRIYAQSQERAVLRSKHRLQEWTTFYDLVK